MNEDIIKELNELIQLDHDATKTYEHALERIDGEDENVRVDLQDFKQDHVRHIEDLRDVIEELGGTPIEPSRDLKSVLLEGVTKLRSVSGTIGALKAMRMNEKLTNRAYDKAMELGSVEAVQDVLEANLADERRHLIAIEAHIARLSTVDAILADDDYTYEDRDRETYEIIDDDDALRRPTS
jgi:rubrerythrin